MSRQGIYIVLSITAITFFAGTAWADGAVYAMTNALGYNQVLVVHRSSDGTLSSAPVQTIATGGGGVACN